MKINIISKIAISSLLLIAALPILSISQTPCNIYVDASPLNRTSGTGEENVISGNYQAVAQQYNSLPATQLKGVKFFGRVNPASGNPTNTVKVVVYNVNQGLPGTIIGSQNVILNSSATSYEVDAIFSSPLSVSGSMIISIEPFSPSSDNFFIQRNVSPDGQNLNLIKIKQANQWFKNLAAGDPAFDYDFQILPIKEVTVTANFNANTTGNATNFNNTSLNGAMYLWSFGDGNQSSLQSPVHNYAASAIYNVTLKSYADPLLLCADSITIPVNVVLTDVKEITNDKLITLTSGLVSDYLVIDSRDHVKIEIVNSNGAHVLSWQLEPHEQNNIKVSLLSPGTYYIRVPGMKSIRFIKVK